MVVERLAQVRLELGERRGELLAKSDEARRGCAHRIHVARRRALDARRGRLDQVRREGVDQRHDRLRALHRGARTRVARAHLAVRVAPERHPVEASAGVEDRRPHAGADRPRLNLGRDVCHLVIAEGDVENVLTTLGYTIVL